MIVILSGLRTTLETELSNHDEDILTVVPEAVYQNYLENSPEYPLRSVPSWNDYAALSQLADDLASANVKSVVTIDEPAVRAAGFLRDLLGLDGLTFSDSVCFTDKALMKRRFGQAKIPSAPYRIVRKLADIVLAGNDLGWPVVVKPRIGASTVNTHIIKDEDHLEELIIANSFTSVDNIPAALKAAGIGIPLDQSPGGFLVEKLIDVRHEYNCEVFMYRGKAIYAIPCMYSNIVIYAKGGTFGTVVLDHEPTIQELRELSVQACVSLGLKDGFAHCELFEDSHGRFLVGEVGARPGGAMLPHLLKLQYGIDVMALHADLAIGREPAMEWRSRPGFVALKGVPMPEGCISYVTPSERIQQLSNVVDLRQFVKIGDSVDGAVGTAASAFAGIVFCEGRSSTEAMRNAEVVASKWEFLVQ